ncbi:MAG: bifunctional methylenetetrahydrofolate dehydrogenase/methenyltetrahydrofolate cyclohydrolase [Epulopiscium sp. Nele67-Bin001]|nr:MAG: bifunctional methylenetetrahydrofolate dehydrogenase/methenyltetrahydrofolate cyclohydrolase [Epulopiscium sp. Nele67-Bin001]
METKIISGTEISTAIKDELKDELERLSITPTLAVVLVGDNQASKVYVSNKEKACHQIGIKSMSYTLPADSTQEDVLDLIEVLNADKNVDGILVQLPLPAHIDEHKVIQAIDETKDVDGFHLKNVGALLVGTDGFVSCTPAGIIELLKRSNIDVAGKKCVIVGRSNIVGKPMCQLLLRENATVVMCHSYTPFLKEETQQADIVVVATGKRNIVTGDMIKPGAVVIDVGINRDENGKLCGDVDFNSCQGIASWITPVPGGVGPMTIAMLMQNCVRAAKQRRI